MVTFRGTTAKMLTASVSAVAMLSMAVAPAQANSLDDEIQDRYTSQSGSGMVFEKVSHPKNGLQQPDGIVDYTGKGHITEDDQSQGDRGQSYPYAVESYGDWVYIGTMYGGIGFAQWILEDAVKQGMNLQEFHELINVMYQGHMYEGEPDGVDAGGMLVKFNIKTGEKKILMSQFAGIDGGNGVIPTFRNAFRYGDKLYFEGMVMDTHNKDLTPEEIKHAIERQDGFPCIYEVDPTNDDKLTCVHNSVDIDGFRKLMDQNIFTSTRAIAPFKNAVIAGDVTVDENGKGTTQLLATANPSDPNSYHVIATMEDFDNMPAINRDDSQGGSGIMQVTEYNGKLYVAMVTGNLATRNKKTGLMRPFAIYVGENNGDPTQKDDWTWRPLVGDKKLGAKYTFGIDPERIASGTCTLQVYNNHLYIAEYNDWPMPYRYMLKAHDMRGVANDIDQAINLYRMDDNENIEMVVGDPTKMFPKGGISGVGSGYGDHMNLYTWQTTVHEGRMYIATYDASTFMENMVGGFNGDWSHMTQQEWVTTTESFVKLIYMLLHHKDAQGNEPQLSAEDEQAFSTLKTKVLHLQQNRADLNNELFMQQIDNALDQLDAHKHLPRVVKNIIKVMKEFRSPANKKALNTMIPHFKQAKRGFGLYELEEHNDGKVTVQTVSDDGFGDPFNYGLRTFCETDDYFFIGTANGLYGTQIWRAKNNTHRLG
ncbi:hypothetical protein D2E26_0520 [Bifidobacterium dolichotidis]|uniref:Uncharacterized protein n=1 Tax=Bifidobacterium dolichotidis TaxID=2306976 RepID=A0A430FT11_9BIFI|nr:hypothetical protein [Bifidobacterium dolichotidis]RSX55957.1 hypothetical protein D2E26_0520 [Bifidobacterium dolichotidis]